MSKRDNNSKDDKIYTQKQLSYLTIEVLKDIIKSRYITTIDMNVKNNKSVYIDVILKHQEENSRYSGNITYRINKNSSIERYSLPTLLIIKILGYYIHEVGLPKKREILLLSKHLDNLLQPLVMDEVVLNIKSHRYKRFANSNIRPYGIKTDYQSLFTLYNLINEENSKYSKDIFNSLQHITIGDNHFYSSDPTTPASILSDIFNNFKTITSIDIIVSHSQTYESILFSATTIKLIKHLSIRTEWIYSNYFEISLKTLNLPLQSLSIPSENLSNSIEHLSIPTLTTLKLYDFSPTDHHWYFRLPNNIVNLHIHFEDYYEYKNKYIISWLLKQESLQHITLGNMVLTPTLHHILRLPNLKSLTFCHGYDDTFEDSDNEGIDRDLCHTFMQWYQQFYNGLRHEFLYNNSSTHVVLKDLRMGDNIIRKDEYLGGVDIQVIQISNSNLLDEEKYIIIYDKDYEWIDKNKSLLTYRFPPKVLIKILLSFSDLQENDINTFARLNHSTMKYARDSLHSPIQNIRLWNVQINLWSKYSILSNNNIGSMDIQIEQLVIFHTQFSNQLTDNIQNNQNNIKDMVFLPNLQKLCLRLDKDDDIPNDILLEIPKLKKLELRCSGHKKKKRIEREDIKTVGYHLIQYIEHKSNKYNNTRNQKQHLMLRELVLRDYYQNITIPSYITDVTITDGAFVSVIGRAANIKNINAKINNFHLLSIIKKMAFKYNVKNQFQQLESMKLQLKDDYLNPKEIAKCVHDLVTYLGSIKSLKSFEVLFQKLLLDEDISVIRNIDQSHAFQLQENHQRDTLIFIRK